MDVEPGGEGSQYEGRQVLVEKPSVDSRSQTNQSNQQYSSTALEPQSVDSMMKRDEAEAMEIRISESVSKDGFAGKTSGHLGKATEGIAIGKTSESHDR